jgi:hypothetical protein
MGRARMMKDMDEWGYTFRSGSAAGWFHGDAEDAREWLQRRGLIDEYDQPSWKLRGDSVDTVALQAIAGVGA